MDISELRDAIPNLLTRGLQHANPQQVLTADQSWWLRPYDAVGVVSVLGEDEIRVTVGVAFDVPYTQQTLNYINLLNLKQLVYGRIYVSGNEESGLAAVLMQDIVRGNSFSWVHVPELQNFIRLAGTMLGTGDHLSKEIVRDLGGRPPADQDHFLTWMLQ